MENLNGGALIKGYELRERIGSGGFGAVYRAYQSSVGREVAIKIILPRFANQPDFIRRFETEAQIIARLEHLHIIPLYDYWRDPDGAYLVMRWLKGGSLQDALREGPLDVQATVLFLDQVTSALALAHRSNIIHRDLKPANILLDEDNNAYVADFGIAKDLGNLRSSTQADMVVGSPDYLSPEQARSEPVTPQTDIYSLGVTLYEALTGQHPFPNVTPIERMYKHLNDPLPPVTNLPSEIAEGINAVIQKATAKDPSHRYSDILSLAADFRVHARLNHASQSVVESLTLREQEVLQRVIEGRSNRDIAQELVVTVATVKWYIKQIYAKLHVRNRVQAIVRARELNLVIKGSSPDASVSPAGATALPADEFAPENPYKGLRAFETADNRDFFGREALTEKLVKRLAEESEGSRFLAVIGPSGSGKSSLVKAGLIPALWRGALPGSERWFVVDMLPGAHPLDELEVALTRIVANQTANLREHLQRDERGLLRAANLILPNDGSQLVLVIDQFEEVFTLLEDEKARIHFLNLLYEAVSDIRSRVRVVVTLRADFYDRPLVYPDFGELVRSRMETVLPLSAEGLERAILRPAERVGVTFEPGLVASIVSEVNYQPGALPLLQYALTELFDLRQGRTLTREAYQAMDGIVGALARRADEIYEGLDTAGQEAAHQMFLRLVTLGEGVEDTRRRAPHSELLAIASDAETMDDIIDAYAAYRLLSLDHDPATRSPTVEVAHEAILREWERLRAWLNESRHDIRMQRLLATSSAEWQNANQDDSFLLRGSRLDQFQMWAAASKVAMTPKERDYLDASIAERERQAIAEQKRQVREIGLERRSRDFLRGLVAVLVLATLGAFGLTAIAVNQGQIASRNAADSQNVALVSGSQAALANGNTDQAIALALRAVTLDPTSARAQVALSEAAYAPGTIRSFVGHTDIVDTVALSPDGRTALSASWDKTVILWDIQTGKALHRFEGHTDRAMSVAFTPDGLTAISGSADQTMIQWDLQTGKIIRRFEGQPDQVWALAISHDGQYVASGGSKGNLILWDIKTGEMLRSLQGHTDGIERIQFSADGANLLSASDDKAVILWGVETGRLIRRFEGHQSIVYSAVFSPDDRLILSGSDDGTMVLWDSETGQSIRRFYETGTATIADVAFSPNGHTILSGGVGGVVLWNIETAQPISRLRGQGGTVTSLAVSSDGRTALSGGDTTLRLWDLEAGQLIRRLDTEGDGAWFTALAASADGRRAIAAWNPDPLTNIIVWDVSAGKEIRRSSIDETINDIAVSPDGQTALFATNHGNAPSDVMVWDVNTGKEIRRLTGHPSGIANVAFSPDGRTAASAGGKGVLILWDVATGKEIRRFNGYESDDPNNGWNYVGFSPDGQTLVASRGPALIVLWNIATGKEIRHFEGHSRETWNVVFSGDGQRAFSGSQDKTAILWDVATGSILQRFSDHSGPIPWVDMTSDGRFGIAGGGDFTGTLWDLKKGELIRRYNAAPFPPLFAPDDRTLLAGIAPDKVEVWRMDLTLDELLAWTRANRYIPELTCEQRALYRLPPTCDADGGFATSMP